MQKIKPKLLIIFVINEYVLKRKVCNFITDSASSNDAFVAKIIDLI